MIPFHEFPKIPRLNRLCTITEKIDGTNGIIHIAPEIHVLDDPNILTVIGIGGIGYAIFAGSHTRWITPEQDNYGFAKFALANAEELAKKLSFGTHYGEWWGGSIQRGYGVQDKRFSLFNTARWGDPAVRPACCGVVPVLYEGFFATEHVGLALDSLKKIGSAVAPGFMDPEGIVVFHHASNHLYKVTIKGDEGGKHAESRIKKERPPRTPRDPSKGGRRIAQVSFEGPDRRKPRETV